MVYSYDRTPTGFFGFNPYALAAQDPEYARMLAAVTNAPTGQARFYANNFQGPDWTVFNSYDKAGDTGMQGEEARLIWQNWDKATNEEKGRFFQIINNGPGSMQKQYQQLYNDRLQAGAREILQNEGFGGNMKSWAALVQGNKTWSNVGGADPNFRTQEILGDQMGNILNQAKDLGVAVPEYLDRRADTRDYLMNQIASQIGGFNAFGMGYNSQGMGSGPGTGGYMGDAAAEEWGRNNVATLGGQWGSPTLNDLMPSGTYRDAYNGFGTGWGSGVGYKLGWMPSGTPSKNNSLLDTGGNGIYNTGITGEVVLFNPNSPYAGSWTGQWDSPGFTPPNFSRDTMTGGTSGSGGPLIFADPSRSGSQSTLNDMDSRYSPDWGNPIQNRGYAYGLTPNEQYNMELYQQQISELMQAYQDQRLPIPPELLYQGGANYFQGSGYGATEQPKYYLPEYSFENAGAGAGTYYDVPGTRTYHGTPLPVSNNDVFTQSYYDSGSSQYTPQPSLATGFNIGALDATYGFNPYAGYTGFAVGPSFDPTNYSLFY